MPGAAARKQGTRGAARVGRVAETSTKLFPDVEDALASSAFHRNPHPVYRILREEAPVYWSGILKQWLVTSYDLVEEVLLKSTVFSNYGYESSFIERLPTEFLIEVDTLRHHWKQEGLMHSGRPKHTRLRRAVGPSFAPKVVSRLEERIQARVTHLLQNAKARNNHQYEVIQGLAQPLPVTVIADVLGVPERYRDRFPVWSASVLRFFGSPQPDPLNAAELDANLVEWRRLIGDLLHSRSRSPRDDFLTTVARAIDNGQMSAEDGLVICVHLLIAGHETTTNLIGNTIYCLVTRHNQLEEARGSAEALQRAVEETLRYEPPIARIRRVCTESYELGGVLIRRGEPVVAVVASAHRDSQRFRRPDEFDLHREMPKRGHLAFGLGPHFCLGAPLARLETVVAVRQFLDRFAEIRLAPSTAPAWRESINHRGLESLLLETG